MKSITKQASLFERIAVTNDLYFPEVAGSSEPFRKNELFRAFQEK
jgi:hypothetical protein